jgi:opacity protein-like surface antigen
MNSMRSIAAAALSLTALAGGAVALGAGTASAASYNGACGAGYAVIDHQDLLGGTTFLTYNSGNGTNCVVTVRDQPGAPINVMAGIGLDMNHMQEDNGNYTTYAGPKYQYAPHTCIEWEGRIQPPPPYQGGNFFIKGGHCQ